MVDTDLKGSGIGRLGLGVLLGHRGLINEERLELDTKMSVYMEGMKTISST